MTITLESIGGTGSGNRAWVAEITGPDAQFGLSRVFLAGVRDYSKANSVRSRGVRTAYALESGKLYEISAPESWKSTERYFATVRDGEIVRLSKEQVLEAVRAAAN